MNQRPPTPQPLCPQCGAEQPDLRRSQCSNCGVDMAQYERFQRLKNRRLQARMAPASAHPLLQLTDPDNPLTLYGRLCVLIGLLFLSWGFITTPSDEPAPFGGFLHLVNTPFHEAGHIVFRPFGPLITALGGSLGQLLMPLICLLTLLLKTKDSFGAAVCLWWLGQNLIDLAPYIDDARSLTLPLLGGNTGETAPYGFHDWQFILTELGWLQYDHTLARISRGCGDLSMLSSLLWGAALLLRQRRIVRYGMRDEG